MQPNIVVVMGDNVEYMFPHKWIVEDQDKYVYEQTIDNFG
jgi:hypothetical protein